MPWFRLDDKSWGHAKVIAVGNAAWGALCRLGAYASDHLTDGVIPSSIAQLVASIDETEALVKHGLLLRREDGSYEIHDFLSYNPSASAVRKLRKERAKAGSRGGSNRAANSKQVLGPGLPVASTPPKQTSTPSRPVPIPTEETLSHAREPAVQEHPSTAPMAPLPKPIPLALPLSDELRAAAAQLGLTDIDACWVKFLGLAAERGQKTESVQGSWMRFIGTEARYQRTERDRERKRNSDHVAAVKADLEVVAKARAARARAPIEPAATTEEALAPLEDLLGKWNVRPDTATPRAGATERDDRHEDRPTDTREAAEVKSERKVGS